MTLQATHFGAAAAHHVYGELPYVARSAVVVMDTPRGYAHRFLVTLSRPERLRCVVVTDTTNPVYLDSLTVQRVGAVLPLATATALRFAIESVDAGLVVQRPLDALTPAQARVVAELLVRGTTPGIALAMGIAEKTVNAQLSTVMGLLGEGRGDRTSFVLDLLTSREAVEGRAQVEA